MASAAATAAASSSEIRFDPIDTFRNNANLVFRKRDDMYMWALSNQEETLGTKSNRWRRQQQQQQQYFFVWFLLTISMIHSSRCWFFKSLFSSSSSSSFLSLLTSKFVNCFVTRSSCSWWTTHKNTELFSICAGEGSSEDDEDEGFSEDDDDDDDLDNLRSDISWEGKYSSSLLSEPASVVAVGWRESAAATDGELDNICCRDSRSNVK